MPYTVRVDSRNERHARLTIFEDGANCGTLTVTNANADAMVKAITSVGVSEGERLVASWRAIIGDNGSQGV